MKQIIKNLIKISTLSLIFILAFYIINTFANTDNNKNDIIQKENNQNYKSINIKPIANVGVAIATNIGTKLNQNKEISQENINNKIYPISDFYINSENIKKSIIESNMIFTKEYYNIIKMDFNSILKESGNREITLTNIVKQLSIRLNNANTNLITLDNQKSSLISEYEKITTQIETLKINLETDFNDNKAQEVFNHTDNYYDLKYKEVNLKTNIIFINNFIRKYLILNNYNEQLIKTLTLNKDILSKDSYIVIPDSGTNLLKEFDLIFTETEYNEK